MLSSMSISEFAQRVSAGDPPPGGGSVAAVSGLMGAAVLAMSMRVVCSDPKAVESSAYFKEKLTQLDCLRNRLEKLAEQDAQVLGELLAVFRCASVESTQTDYLQKREMVVAAAADVPLEMARVSLEILEIGWSVVDTIHKGVTAGDFMIGVFAAHTGVKAALLGAAMNLEWLHDSSRRKAIEGHVALLGAAADELLQKTRQRILDSKCFAVLQEQ